MFQNYLACLASAGPNHEAVPCRFDDCIRDEMKVVHTQNSLDLSEKSSQEPKVSSGHPYEASYDFWDELFVRECDAGGPPSPFEQFLHLRCIERTELMHKTNTRVELRKAGDALLNSRHADEDHTGSALVKDRSHLFEAVHLKAIGLVDQDQSGRIRNCPLFGLISLIRFKVGWINCWAVAWGSSLACP
jgi:hypothetical protein